MDFVAARSGGRLHKSCRLRYGFCRVGGGGGSSSVRARVRSLAAVIASSLYAAPPGWRRNKKMKKKTQEKQQDTKPTSVLPPACSCDGFYLVFSPKWADKAAFDLVYATLGSLVRVKKRNKKVDSRRRRVGSERYHRADPTCTGGVRGLFMG